MALVARWIFFDAVGTLIHPEPTATTVYLEAAAKRGVTLDAVELQKRFRRALQTHFAPDDELAQDRWWTDEQRERERWRAIVTDSLGEAARDPNCFEELWHHFSQPGHWRLDPAIDSVWRSLRERGLRIAMASNFDARLETICRGCPPLDSADRIFHSANLGTRKPGMLFFRRIERALGIEASDAVLVGDDWDNDYHAALSAGWRAFWLHRSERQVPHGVQALSDLRELLTRLDG